MLQIPRPTWDTSVVLYGCWIWWLSFCSVSFAFSQQTTNSWQFYRGENFDGHSPETGLVDNWPDKGPPVLWVKELGAGYSAFVGDGDRVFTQYQSLSGQFVICLDAKSGETIWKHRYAWPYQPASLYPGPRSTPTIEGDRVYFTTPTGLVGCLNADTGKSIWTVDAAKKFGAPEVEFGYACSPVFNDGMILLPVGGTDASMVALNQDNGEVIWNSGNESISYCSAYPIEFEGRKLVVGYFKNKLSLFDRNDGTQLATIDVSYDYDEHSAWPVYREPYLWSAGPFRAGSQLLKLKQTETDKIGLELVYKSETMSNDVASCVLVGDELYGYDLRDVQSKVHRPSRGQFICMDFMTGKTLWKNGTLGRRKLNKNGMVSSQSTSNETDVGHASVIYADGKLILFNDTGDLILGKAQSDGFVELARTKALGGEICWVQPILMNQCVFVRNHSKAICIYLGDVDKLDVPADEIEFASDIRQSEYVDLSAILLGTEPKYAMTSPEAPWLLRWFVISLILGWGAAPLLAIVVGRMQKWISTRTSSLGFALCFGLVGTTVAGRWFHEFYFSWPIALLITFEWVVCQIKTRDSTIKQNPWLARLSLLLFIATCFGYFWLCRRLSLAFEWTFLIGFPCALPFLWLVKNSVQRGQSYNFRQWLAGAIAFSAFYWAGAGIMLWKYPG